MKKVAVVYTIKQSLQKNDTLITLLPNSDTPINLMGKDIRHVVEATNNAPEKTRIIRGATQEDLRILYEANNDCIEKLNDMSLNVDNIEA